MLSVLPSQVCPELLQIAGRTGNCYYILYVHMCRRYSITAKPRGHDSNECVRILQVALGILIASRLVSSHLLGN